MFPTALDAVPLASAVQAYVSDKGTTTVEVLTVLRSADPSDAYHMAALWRTL